MECWFFQWSRFSEVKYYFYDADIHGLGKMLQ